MSVEEIEFAMRVLARTKKNKPRVTLLSCLNDVCFVTEYSMSHFHITNKKTFLSYMHAQTRTHTL